MSQLMYRPSRTGFKEHVAKRPKVVSADLQRKLHNSKTQQMTDYVRLVPTCRRNRNSLTDQTTFRFHVFILLLAHVALDASHLLLGSHQRTSGHLCMAIASRSSKGIIYDKDGKFVFKSPGHNEGAIIVIEDRKRDSEAGTVSENTARQHRFDAPAALTPLVQAQTAAHSPLILAVPVSEKSVHQQHQGDASSASDMRSIWARARDGGLGATTQMANKLKMLVSGQKRAAQQQSRSNSPEATLINLVPLYPVVPAEATTGLVQILHPMSGASALDAPQTMSIGTGDFSFDPSAMHQRWRPRANEEQFNELQSVEQDQDSMPAPESESRGLDLEDSEAAPRRPYRAEVRSVAKQSHSSKESSDLYAQDQYGDADGLAPEHKRGADTSQVEDRFVGTIPGALTQNWARKNVHIDRAKMRNQDVNSDLNRHLRYEHTEKQISPQLVHANPKHKVMRKNLNASTVGDETDAPVASNRVRLQSKSKPTTVVDDDEAHTALTTSKKGASYWHKYKDQFEFIKR